jgi:hypothetical protein
VCPTAAHSSTQQHTATHSSTQQYTATHSNTQQHTATHSKTQQDTATHSSTQQHTATHSNTQQYTALRAIAMYFFVNHFNILLPTVSLHVFRLPSGFWTQKLHKCLLSSGMFVSPSLTNLIANYQKFAAC